MNQILAIIWLKYRLFAHRLHTTTGIINEIARALSLIAGGFMSLGMAVMFGFLLISAESATEERAIPVLFYLIFYILFFIGVFAPVAFGSSSQLFEPARLLIFPISRIRLYSISLGSSIGNPEHVFNLPTLTAVFIITVVVHRVNFVMSFLVIISAVLFMVIWNNTLILILQSLLRKRKLRELVAIISFVILILFVFIPQIELMLKEGFTKESHPYLKMGLNIAITIAKYLPPSLSARSFTALYHDEPGSAFFYIVLLALWNACGIVIGYYWFMNYHLSEKEKVQKKLKQRRPPAVSASPEKLISLESIALRFLSPELVGIAHKDLLYLFRSVSGKFNLIMMPVFVVFTALVFARNIQNPWLGIDPKDLVLFGTVLYAAIFPSNNFNNAFGWDGNGIMIYFITPVAEKKILLGKNIALWIYSAILFMLCMVTWSILINIPDLRTFIMCMLLFSVSVLSYNIMGNITSVIFPAKIDMSSFKSNPPTASVLLTWLAAFLNIVFIGACIIIPYLLGISYLQPILLLALLFFQLICYTIVLSRLSYKRVKAGK